MQTHARVRTETRIASPRRRDTRWRASCAASRRQRASGGVQPLERDARGHQDEGDSHTHRHRGRRRRRRRRRRRASGGKPQRRSAARLRLACAETLPRALTRLVLNDDVAVTVDDSPIHSLRITKQTRDRRPGDRLARRLAAAAGRVARHAPPARSREVRERRRRVVDALARVRVAKDDE